MKEEWLFHGAVVPIDVETTAALVAEIKRLIDVIGGMALAQSKQEPVLWMMPDGKTADKWALQFYGGQKGKPLYTTPPQRKPLTDEEIDQGLLRTKYAMQTAGAWRDGVEWAIKQLQERNT